MRSISNIFLSFNCVFYAVQERLQNPDQHWLLLRVISILLFRIIPYCISVFVKRDRGFVIVVIIIITVYFMYKHWKTSFEKNCFFCVGEYAEYGFDQQRLIWYVCRLWDMVFS